MNKAITILFLLLFGRLVVSGENIIYTNEDSVRIETVLARLAYLRPEGNGAAVLSTAHYFVGTPYVSGTLDRNKHEQLVVNTTELDCTTFVEIVTAIVLTHREGKTDFSSFCRNLERIRYRNGELNGYESRLHYMSQWIADSAKTGIIEEVAGPSHIAKQQLDLSFMSNHPESYQQLKNNKPLTEKISQYEKQFRGTQAKYIPKKLLGKSKKELDINDGDIITLVTSIKGLDVTHCGFAFYKSDSLHLIHASSIKGAVVADSTSLYNYQKCKKTQSGIRVFRICD